MKKTYSPYAIALTAALGLFMAVLDNTVVNVALTPIQEAFAKSDSTVSISTVQWVITGYFLAQAAVIPAAGYFSNRFGIKRVFILCLIFFTIGSLLCGLAQNVTMLIFFRILQGIGGGALFPLASAIAFQAFPPAKRAGASAVVGIPVLLAPAFGPTIGGLLTVNFGWEYIFFVNVPVGFIAVYLAWRIFPADNVEEKAQNRRPFDIIGLTLVISGILAVVYAFSLVAETRSGTITAANPRGDINGWGYEWVWILMAIGLVLLTAFALYELRVSKDPVIDLRIFKQYDFLMPSIVSWFSAVVVFGSLFLLPVFLERVRVPHLSALDTGLALMPQGLAAAVAVAAGGRLYNQVGVRAMAVVGSVLLLFSSWELTQLTSTTDSWWLLPWLIMRGFGFGLVAIPVQTLALQAITGAALPKASSLFNATRQIASAIGIAVLTTLFVQQSASHGTELRNQLATGANAARPSQQTIDNLAAQAGTQGMNDVFMFVTIGSIFMLLLCLALPGNRRKAEATTGTGEPAPRPAMVAE